MKKKVIGLIGLISASSLAVTMKINSYGVIKQVPVFENDSIQISADGLYAIHKTTDPKKGKNTDIHYLGFINQLTFTNDGGNFNNIFLDIAGKGRTLTSDQIAKIVLEPSNLDKTRDYDGDGLPDWDEYTRSLTDPQKVDSDGDGWWDQYETTLFSSKNPLKFNPRVADMPEIELKMREIPSVTYNYTRSGQKDTSLTISNGKENSTSNDKGWSHDWNWGLSSEGGWGGIDAGWTWTIGGSFNYGLNYSFSESNSATINSEHATSIASSIGWSLNGATITAPVVLYNSGNVAVNITKPILELYSYSAFSGVTSLGDLSDNTQETPFTLGPGDSIVLNVKKNISIEDANEIALYANYLQVRLQKATSMTSSKINAKGGAASTTDFTSELTEIPAKTATMVVDFGGSFDPNGKDPLTTIYARIATLTKYNPEYTSTDFSDQYGPVYLTEGLNTVGLKFAQDSNGQITSINGIVNQQGNSGEKWTLVENYVDPSTKKMRFTPYNGPKLNPDTIGLYPAHQYTLVYTGDDDQDGVPNYIEKIKKSDPKKKDTDGDGLTDDKEIYGFSPDSTWTYTNNGKSLPHIVQTDPTNTDTDNDGILDNIDPRPITRVKSDSINTKSVKLISLNGKDTVSIVGPNFEASTTQKDKIGASEWLEINTDQVFSKITAFHSNGSPLIIDQIDPGKDFVRFKITGIPAESKDSVNVKIVPANGDESKSKSIWIKYTSAFQGVNSEIKLAKSPTTPWKDIQYSYLFGAQVLADSRTNGMLLVRSKTDSQITSIPTSMDRRIGTKLPGTDWTIIADSPTDTSKTYVFKDDSVGLESGTKYFYKLLPYTINEGSAYYYYGSNSYNLNTSAIYINSLLEEFRYDYNGAGDDPLIQTALEINGNRNYKHFALANTGSNIYNMTAGFADGLSFKDIQVNPDDEISFILWVYEHELWFINTVFKMDILTAKNSWNDPDINNVFGKWGNSPKYQGYQFTVKVSDLLSSSNLNALDAKDSRDLLINSSGTVQYPSSIFTFNRAMDGSVERKYSFDSFGLAKMKLEWSVK